MQTLALKSSRLGAGRLCQGSGSQNRRLQVWPCATSCTDCDNTSNGRGVGMVMFSGGSISLRCGHRRPPSLARRVERNVRTIELDARAAAMCKAQQQPGAAVSVHDAWIVFRKPLQCPCDAGAAAGSPLRELLALYHLERRQRRGARWRIPRSGRGRHRKAQARISPTERGAPSRRRSALRHRRGTFLSATYPEQRRRAHRPRASRPCPTHILPRRRSAPRSARDTARPTGKGNLRAARSPRFRTGLARRSRLPCYHLSLPRFIDVAIGHCAYAWHERFERAEHRSFGHAHRTECKTVPCAPCSDNSRSSGRQAGQLQSCVDRLRTAVHDDTAPRSPGDTASSFRQAALAHAREMAG